MNPSVRAPALAGLGTANRQWSTNDEDDDNDIEASDYDDQKEEAPEALEPEALAPTAHDDWIAGDSVTNAMLDAEQQRSLCTSGASAPADAPCEPVTGVITGDDLRRARSQHGLPGGGLWFFRQTPMLDAMKRRGAGFPVAWQTRKKDSNEVTFMYGLYEDVEGFFAEMRKCPEGARHGFELIPDLRECVAYADLEWEGEEDAEHSKMRHVISVVRSVFEKAHNRKAEVYVCRSTRRKGETWKNSYHLIVKNLVFKTNHGAMKVFWKRVQTLLSDAGCYWVNKDKQTHILDMAVYTRNRLIRPPLSSKRGGTPFKRINGDPFDENDALTSVYEDGDFYQGFLPFVVSGPRADGDMPVIIPDDDSRPGPSKGSSIVIGKRLRDDEHGANKRQTKTPIDTSEEEGRCRREGATSPSVAIRPDEHRFKIEEITALLVKIHPDHGGNYTDWWKVLCAVKNAMEGARGDEVYQVLDAFSSIRAGYKDAGDVRTRYADIPLRDSSQNRSTIGTLVHLGREFPALTLDSSITPEREQCDALRQQWHAFERAGQAWHTATNADGHAAETLRRSRVQVRHTLLELLFANADSSKTSWLFFAQSCSILARTEDRSHVQSRILEHYARINVSIPEEALELVFRPVKSGLYSSAVMKYVKDELLDRLQSCAGDTKTEEESEDVGSCGEHAEPRRKKKRCEIVPKRGRASKIDTAKLLVQVPQSIVELSGAQIRQHLREPDEEKELREALQTCLSLGPSSIAIQMALEGDEMAREKTLGGDDAEIASGTMVRRDQPGGVSVPPHPPVLSQFDLQGVAEYIRTKDCRNIIVMAGAGISVSAGIPDFRTPGTGLYDNLAKYKLPEPAAVFNIDFFRQNPAPFYTLAKELFPGQYKPTPTHNFIRLLHDQGRLLRCFTQNIDSLEVETGIPADKLVACHGNFDTATCIDTGNRVAIAEVREAIMAGEEGWRAMNAKHGGLVKPDIIFFGDKLPDRFYELAGLKEDSAECDLDRCDLLIVMGTSLKVRPFASLIGKVPDTCPRLLLNRQPVPEFGFRSNYRDVGVLGNTDDAVKQLAELMGCATQLDQLVGKFGGWPVSGPPLENVIMSSGCDADGGVSGDNDLSSIVTAHTVLRLKDKHARDRLRPDEMHRALIKSIEPSVDWRLVVAWFGLVMLYQTGCRMDADDTRKEKARQAERAKKEAQKEAQRAADKAKKEAETFKDKFQKEQATLEMLQASGAKIQRVQQVEARVKWLKEKTIESERKAEQKLEGIKAGTDVSSADEGNNHSEELAGEVAETLPGVLEDHYRESTSVLRPSEAELEACWKQTRSRLLFRATPSQRELVGSALCSVLFDKLFSYSAVKQQFEKTHMKIRDLKAFAALDSQGGLNIHAPTTISTYDQNLMYWTDSYKREQFVPVWLRDPHVREYARIDSIPPPRDGTSAPEDVYNTWPGFLADSLPAVAESDVLPLVEPILDHIRDVITGKENLDFLVAWLAQQVQAPTDTTRVAIVLQGEQGVGKNIIFDFYIDKVLGAGSKARPENGAGFRTAKPSEFVFGSFSTAHQNKVFVMVDEVRGDQMRPIMNEVKDRITCPTVPINAKHVGHYVVSNLCNFMFTTNDMDPIALEPEERRFVVFACNGCRKKNWEYFNNLKTHTSRDDVARAFLQYLRKVDVGKFLPFEAHRPQTEAYFAMQRGSIPLFYKFLSYVVARELHRSKGEVVFKVMKFFDDFTEWGRAGNYNVKAYTVSGFGAEATQLIFELDGVDPGQLTFNRKKKDHGMVYLVDCPKLKKHLERKKRFDSEAADQAAD